ncbi:MAG TPA: hypothetical protein VMD55_03715 [Terracidiphilus sp.]|jgi:hypothetical protein|nr:hypothetical protein [Terracidiphilus sp.]
MKGILVILGCGFGYVISRYVPDGPLAVYIPLLVSYHLLLGVLVVTAMQEKGHKLNPVPAALTHAAFFVLLLIAASAGGMIPYFEYLRFLLPALAYVELTALLRGKGGKAAEGQDPASNSTAEDYEDFIHYMRGNNRPFAKPGFSVRDEFNCWLAHRAKHPPMPSMDAGERPAA